MRRLLVIKRDKSQRYRHLCHLFFHPTAFFSPFCQNILKYLLSEAKEKNQSAFQKGWKITIIKVISTEDDNESSVTAVLFVVPLSLNGCLCTASGYTSTEKRQRLRSLCPWGKATVTTVLLAALGEPVQARMEGVRGSRCLCTCGRGMCGRETLQSQFRKKSSRKTMFTILLLL